MPRISMYYDIPIRMFLMIPRSIKCRTFRLNIRDKLLCTLFPIKPFWRVRFLRRSTSWLLRGLKYSMRKMVVQG